MKTVNNTMKQSLLVNLLVMLMQVSQLSFALEPANPQTNAKARAVLNYLEQLPGKQEKRLLSGQFTSYGQSATLAECQAAFDSSGRWPAMIGLDYADFATGGVDTKTVNRIAIDYCRHGGIVTISTHLYNPANPQKGGLRDKGVALESLVTPGHAHRRRWIEELDALAEGLVELQDAGVVVLWRPFHEMNGDWFWWGNHEPATFIRVWKDMFEYFTQSKRLNNLLWVYGPNHGLKTTDYYPGDKYVDVVGLDVYTDYIDHWHILGYQKMLNLHKPFGFTEFGPHGSHNPPGNYDYPRLIRGIQSNFPQATFFLSWHAKWSLSQNRNAKQLLEHPWVINREDLPVEFAAPK